MNTLTFKEFEDIINNIKEAFDLEMELDNLSRKYIEKGVLYEYLSSASTFLVTPIFTLLNKVFGFDDESDLFSWWCFDMDFGKDFSVGDMEDEAFPKRSKFRKPDISTTEGLYNYCVALSKLSKEQ